MKKYFVSSFFIHSCVFALVTFFSFNPEWFPLPMVKPEARPNLITFSIEETSAVAGSSAPGFFSGPSKATSKIKDSKIKHQAPQFNSKVNSHLPQGDPTYSGPTNNSPSYSDPTHFDDIDDIAMPELAHVSSEDLSDSTHSSLRFDEIKKSFDEIDNEDSKKIVAVNNEFEQLSSEELASIDKQSDTIKEQNASLDSLVSKRKSELAQEKSNLGIQRQKTKVASNASGESSSSSFGRGKAGQISGDNQNGAGGTGTTGEIRKLEDLRQVPGNLKPEYDTEDRVQGLSGNIVVYGYVTKSGSISSFKLMQSTGHRSLDQKTLNALKRWRFYPGQDGWVELPFKWDLKGGVQQKPTLLKRQ
ncbi:MAG: TonB family protein [Deltaproteobacteria bacterium]|nr:TonB family protein [Deltaproteobacteria bacterium]